MSTQTEVNVKDLEHRIGKLQKNLAFVSPSSSLETSDLFQIIHWPGWTTLIDVEDAGQILEAMDKQAVAMRSMRDTLERHVKARAR